MQGSILFKNAQLHFTDQGKGRAIVLVHGFLENQNMWHQIVPSLKKRNRVITVDLPGHGQSDCLGYVHSMELLAEAVHAVIRHLRIRKCVLVGHSLGGYVSLAFAELFPKKVKALCLMNSNAYADNEERIQVRNRAISLIQKQRENLIRMSFLNLFDPTQKEFNQEEKEIALNQALNTSIQGYIAMQEGMKQRPNRCAIVQQGAFKTLYIIGEKDPIFSSETSIAEAKENGAAYVVLPNGHMSHIENTNNVIAILMDFVKGV